MLHSIRRLTSVASVFAMLAASALGTAQTAAPARETPRPQDIDPAVNTSAPAQTPARETPRPQDVDPALNTSAPASDAVSPPSSRPGDAATAGASARPAATGAAAGGQSGRSGAPVAPSSSKSSSGKPGTAAGKSATAADGKPKGKRQDRLELDTTQITGNRELPKVLYIVPWKRSDLGDLVGKPVNSLLDEVLTPVDRDVFKRENRYYRALTPAEGQSPAASGAPVSGAAANGATPSGSAAPAARDER